MMHKLNVILLIIPSNQGKVMQLMMLWLNRVIWMDKINAIMVLSDLFDELWVGKNALLIFGFRCWFHIKADYAFMQMNWSKLLLVYISFDHWCCRRWQYSVILVRSDPQKHIFFIRLCSWIYPQCHVFIKNLMHHIQLRWAQLITSNII